MQYFRKAILSNALRFTKGGLVPFESCVENSGVIALDETKPEQAEQIADLNKIAGSRGVSKITAAQYEECKKKQSSRTLPDQSPKLRLYDPTAVKPFRSQEPAKTAPVVTAAERSVAAPTSTTADTVAAPAEFKPRVGRPKKNK